MGPDLSRSSEHTLKPSSFRDVKPITFRQLMGRSTPWCCVLSLAWSSLALRDSNSDTLGLETGARGVASGGVRAQVICRACCTRQFTVRALSFGKKVVTPFSRA